MSFNGKDITASTIFDLWLNSQPSLAFPTQKASK